MRARTPHAPQFHTRSLSRRTNPCAPAARVQQSNNGSAIFCSPHHILPTPPLTCPDPKVWRARVRATRCRAFFFLTTFARTPTCPLSTGLNPPSPKDLHPRKGEAYLCRDSFAFADASLGAALYERMRRFLPQDVEGRYTHAHACTTVIVLVYCCLCPCLLTTVIILVYYCHCPFLLTTVIVLVY